MAEIRLGQLLIGAEYAAELRFPAGWLASGETLAGDLVRWPSQNPPAASFSQERTGDNIVLSLTEEQTAALKPGSYTTRLHLISGDIDQPLTNSVFVLEAVEG